MIKKRKRKTDRKNLFDYRAWSEEEIRIIRRVYPSNGRDATQQALVRAGYDRSLSAINCRAKEQGLLYQASLERQGKYVRLVVVDSLTCPSGESRVSGRALRAAKRDGVLIRESVSPYPYMVPVDWAAKYAEEIARYDMEARHKLATWWRNHRVAQEFRITEEHLSVAKRIATPLGRAIRTVPHKVYELHNENRQLGVPGVRVRLWEPTAAVRAAAAYHQWLENSPNAEHARFAKMREAIKKIRRAEALASEE